MTPQGKVEVDPSELDSNVRISPVRAGEPGVPVEVDPGAVTASPDAAALQQLEQGPGIDITKLGPGGTNELPPWRYEGAPVYQVAPTQEMPPAPAPMTAGEALVTNPAKQIWSGVNTAAAAANRLTANTFHLFDTAASKIAAITGTDKGGIFKQLEDWAREQQKGQEQTAGEMAGGRQDLPSQLFRTGASAAASIPAYGAATALGGPVGGMAALGALETADQGPKAMLEAAAQNALGGKALEVMGPASRPIRLFGAGAMTYAQLRLQGVDHETALANAMTMGGMSAMHPGGKTAMEMARDAVSPGGTLRPQASIIKSTLTPVQQQAIDYLQSEGVPLTTFQQTGNRYAGALEQTTAHTPLGAQRAREFHAGTQEAMAGLSEKLAGEVHPEPVSPYEGGKAAGDILDQHVAELAGQSNQAYKTAWQHAGEPEFTKSVVVKTRSEPVLDEAGKPTGKTKAVPVYKDVNMPVDVRFMKALAADQLDKYEYLPAAERAQSAAYSVLTKISKGDNFITAQQAEEALKGLKAEAGYDTDPNLRNVAQGTAAQMIPRLQATIDAAVAETGQDSIAGLQTGRKLHAQKMDVAEFSKKLREEPVQAFGQLTMSKDAGVDFLKEIAKRAPGALPKIGRAYLDNLFDQATKEGGWMRADGVFRQWDKLGDQTKALLFPEPSQRQALDRFFLASKITAERINTSGTALVKEAQDAGINALKWAKGYVAGRLLFTPKGIQFLTGIAQNPPITSSATAAMKAQAAKVFGPPGKPPEEPPEGQPPAGGAPPAGPGPAEGEGGLYDQLQQAGEEAKQRLKKGWTGGQLYSMFPGDKAIDLATLTAAGVTKGVKSLANRAINDMGEWGAARIANGAVTFPEWKKQMLDDAMDVHPQAVEFLRRNARQVYQAAQQTWKDRQGETLNGKITDIEKILQYAEAGKEGTYWYKNVKPQLEPIFGPNTDLFLNFLAATSPRTPVADNVTRAIQSYSEYLSGKPFSTEFEAHLKNLQRAVKGEPLSGLKVGSFGPNLLGDFIKVTVDTWMGQAYGFKGGISDPQYRFLDYAISQAAKAKGLQPAEMQAAIWTGIKKLEGDPRLTAEPFETVVKQYLKENPEIAKQIDKAMRGAAPPDTATVPTMKQFRAGGEKEPPVKSGFVRLYRGHAVGETPTRSLEGNWWTPEREHAETVALDGDGHRQVSYVDIPKADLEQYSAFDHPEAAKMIGPGEDPYILPRDISATRKPLYRYRAPK